MNHVHVGDLLVFCLSITRLPNYSITQSREGVPPRLIPVIPIWRAFEHLETPTILVWNSRPRLFGSPPCSFVTFVVTGFAFPMSAMSPILLLTPTSISAIPSPVSHPMPFQSSQFGVHFRDLPPPRLVCFSPCLRGEEFLFQCWRSRRWRALHATPVTHPMPFQSSQFGADLSI